MEAAAASQLAQAGLAFLLLGVGIIYFYRRDVRSEARMDAQQKACEARETILVGRIQKLEDDRHENSKTILTACIDTLETCAKALASNADTFRTLTALEEKREGSGEYRRRPD